MLCPDPIPVMAQWLRDLVDARVAAGAPRKAHVMPLGAMLAAWVQTNPLAPAGNVFFSRAAGARPQGLSPSQRREAALSGKARHRPRLLPDGLVDLRVAAGLALGTLALGVALGKRLH